MFYQKPFQACLLLCLLSFNLLRSVFSKPTTPRRHCPVDGPSDDLRASHAYLQQAEPLDNNLWNASSLEKRTSRHHQLTKRQATSPYYTVDTYFHVVSDTASASPSSPNYVTDTMITNQFNTIAIAYTNASIGYHYMGVTRTVNSTWASNGDDLAMKSALRQGTYSSLNVYFQSELQSAPGTPGVPSGSVLLGYCSLPSAGITPTTPAYEYTIDGCNILSSTMPGGTFQQYNEGGTAVHEIGHWNGLLHPFQDNTCDYYDYGDYVADTPQELTSTSKCPFIELPVLRQVIRETMSDEAELRRTLSCDQSPYSTSVEGRTTVLPTLCSSVFSAKPAATEYSDCKNSVCSPRMSFPRALSAHTNPPPFQDTPWLIILSFTAAGCPATKDTCPNSGVPAGYDGTGGVDPYGPQGYSGPDPIHNYMDYSTDACYTGFTPGQGARMLNIWQIYRQGL